VNKKLEKQKRMLELNRVKVARQELELKIELALDEIERLKAHIEIQNKREQELEKDIKELME
jgi:hypothetical protein